MNRVTSKTVPNIGTTNYVYDIITGMDAGTHEESTTDPKGNITLKIYDKVGRLSKVIADGTTTTYSYYDNGSLESVIYTDGSGEYYTYYSDNLLNTLINKKANGAAINSYSYTYDSAHNILTKVDGKGTTIYTYDNLNRLSTVTAPDTTLTTYNYDAAGNRSIVTTVNGTVTTITNYNYDDQNRLTSSTIKANGIVTESVAYTYDNNGNELTSIITPYVNGVAGATQTTTNTYDELNELIQTATPNGTSIVNIYNGEGIRVAKATNGDIRRYLYEGDKVILETDVHGTQIARNVYGTNLISRIENGVTGYYFYNGHADVTSIVGGDGATLATYYYDEFGNLVSSTGSFDNPYRYAGYQYDRETDTYYLMARMYDPSTGRFLQEDSYRGDIKDPLSLNYYAYCSGNPLIYSDPNGHRRIDEASLQEETDEERHDSLVDEKKAMASEGGKSAANKELYGPPAPSKASISTKAVTNIYLQSIIDSITDKIILQKGFTGGSNSKSGISSFQSMTSIRGNNYQGMDNSGLGIDIKTDVTNAFKSPDTLAAYGVAAIKKGGEIYSKNTIYNQVIPNSSSKVEMYRNMFDVVNEADNFKVATDLAEGGIKSVGTKICVAGAVIGGGIQIVSDLNNDTYNDA